MGDIEPFDPAELQPDDLTDTTVTLSSMTSDYLQAIVQPEGITPEQTATFKSQFRTGFEQMFRGVGTDPATVDIDAIVDDIYNESMANHQPGEPYVFPESIVGKYPALDTMMNRSYQTLYDTVLNLGAESGLMDAEAINAGDQAAIDKAVEVAKRTLGCDIGQEVLVIGSNVVITQNRSLECTSEEKKLLEDIKDKVGKNQSESTKTRYAAIILGVFISLIVAGGIAVGITWAVQTQKSMDQNTGCYYIDASKGISQQITGGGTGQCGCCGGPNGPFVCKGGTCCNGITCEPTGQCVCYIPPPSIAPDWLSGILASLAAGVEWAIFVIIGVIVAIIVIWLIIWAVRRFRGGSSE